MRKTNCFITAAAALLLLATCVNAWAGGPNLDLSRYRGKVVYLDFWASWCPPCRESFPWLNAMQQKYKTRGLVVIGVNVDENTKDALHFLQDTPAHFRIVYDPKGILAQQYNLLGMPSSFIIGRNGNVDLRHMGFRDDMRKSLENDIRTALTTPGPIKASS